MHTTTHAAMGAIMHAALHAPYASGCEQLRMQVYVQSKICYVNRQVSRTICNRCVCRCASMYTALNAIKCATRCAATCATMPVDAHAGVHTFASAMHVYLSLLPCMSL